LRFGWFAHIPAKKEILSSQILFTDRVDGGGQLPIQEEFGELQGRATPKRSTAERNE
jgi:hypothetical protein